MTALTQIVKQVQALLDRAASRPTHVLLGKNEVGAIKRRFAQAAELPHELNIYNIEFMGCYIMPVEAQSFIGIGYAHDNYLKDTGNSFVSCECDAS